MASLQPDYESEGGPNKNYTFDLYAAPWSRIQTYLIGVTLGYICFSIPSPVPLRMWQSLIAHVTSFVLICAPIYSSYWAYDNEWVEAGNILYITFARTVFAIGFAGEIYLCFIGSGGFIDWFFSWPIFHILAKLTYAAYLFHFIVIELYFLSFPHLPYLSDSNAIMFFFAGGVMTFVLSFALHLTVELPFAKLERVLLSPFVKS